MRGRRRRCGRLSVAATGLFLVTACGWAGSAGSTTTGVYSPVTATSSPAVAPTTSAGAAGTPSLSAPATLRSETSVPPIAGPMLWPFVDAAAVAAWKAGNTAGAADAWHLDAGQTALRFVRDYLGYTELDRVTSTNGSATQTVVGVGSVAEGTTASTAGLLRLVRASAQDPWEVVGTQDSDLTVTAPSAGQAVTSPLTVAGTITGVDESIAVALRAPAVDGVLGQVSGIGAGGTQQPWTASVPFTAPGRTTITVAVSTGGHLQAVERFAVTGAVTG
jgi:hypothetical protein